MNHGIVRKNQNHYPERPVVDLARARYRARASQRHAGHLDGARSDQELWSEPSRLLGLGPVVVVDTSGPVDIAELAATVAQVLGAT